MSLVKCKECGKEVSSMAKSCPKCGSANTKVISGASKAVSVALWGAFAANKVMSKYQCRNCNHKF